MKREKLNLKKKKVTVMGIGLHGGGVDMIKWLSQQGARVIATDKKSKESLAPSLEKIKGLKNVTTVIGQHRMEDFQSVDLVIKNPMVPWSNKYIQVALKNKIPVEMDSSLFFKACPTKNIIGVTGTKGKTTTSLLIAEILKTAGRKVIKVGIGQGTVMNKLDDIKKKDWVVFELSSWRLSALRRNEISPRYAIFTNIFQDHLNYYSSMEKYIKDKRAIFEQQKSKGILVLNYNQEEVRSFQDATKGKVAFFSKEKINKENVAYLEENEIRFNRAGIIGSVMRIDEIKMRGEHNLSNILATCAMAIMLEIDPKKIKEAIINFKGVPHRLELVRKINEIKFINDTTATTPESAVAGIEAFKKEENVYLIAGGANKKLSLEPLARKIAETENLKKVFLLDGAATEELKKNLEQFNGGDKIMGVYESMEEAVIVANQEAKLAEEATVLLSPGCASFGMFINEFDRGDKFKEVVEKL